MIKEKKTLYEILGVSPNASDSEIKTAYQNLSKNLQSAKNDTNRDDVDLKLKVINVAFNTLSITRTRDAYDARLAGLNVPKNTTTPPLSLIPLEMDEASSLKNEAMSLKTEAISLKAESVSLRADVIALKVERGYSGYQSTESVLEKSSRLLSPVKKAFAIVGSLVAIGLVIQLIFMLMINRQATTLVGNTSKAEEKVMLQDYYQRTGVRVASKAEMDLLEAASHREEQEQNKIREQERAKQQEDRKYQQFVEDGKQEGEIVSQNLQLAEEKARYEEDQKKRQAQEDQRRQDELEAERIQREKDSWQNTLTN
ncbi:J domain-containing protein [Sulfuriferula nivalis]|uniref:J domain-containing protein n=1 Tax=Sulfuriferula nivalis TaxID=2675298 RepID=UPI0015D28655|nr:J domain-containing protein [Sulfuriferula nivalis]